MDTFGFTKKKFQSLSRRNQHQHIIKWLSAFYQKLTSNRVDPALVDLFSFHYNQILGWINADPFIPDEKNNTKVWIERISDEIHSHRLSTGQSLKDHDLLPPLQTLDRSEKITRLDCHMALDGLRSLFNVGSIFRSCEAAGFTSVILGNTPGKEHPRIQKTAMGSHQWIEQEKTCDLAQTLFEKKETGYKIIGIETAENATAFDEYTWQEKSIVVLGNEEYGISSHVLQTCDDIVSIPMFGNKNSINVANAAAIIVFQMATALFSIQTETGLSTG